MLRARDIISAAEARIGISDPETHLHPALDALAASLNGDNRLSAQGEAAAHRSLLTRTMDRLEGLKWVDRFPEIAQERIEAPLFLTGLPHSGTGLLHELVGRDPRFRTLRTWEALMPNPPPGYDAASVARRRAQEEAVRRHLPPAEADGFEALHLIDGAGAGAEECHAILEQGYAAGGFFHHYDTPSHFDYVTNRMAMTGAYHVHRRQLQLLQWRSGARRWALAYPGHLLAMDAIRAVYPDARFAMTHRDPVQIVASLARMTMALRATRYDPPADAHRAGKQMLDFVRRHVDRIMAFCAGPNADRVIHVGHDALTADPVREVRAVQDALGIGTRAAVEDAIGGWRRPPPPGREKQDRDRQDRDRQDRDRAHDPALEPFGIEPDAAAELFADYRHRFTIPREQEALPPLRETA
ncbi:sulfotransferase [Sphingobium sufflavum]|uniref:sulfotransferase family protein n=1 Tax=Sphingobium sufflavum TaxID=1129547 RepID=UPI001F20176F|nr:sulfotransferase [Sphingobium sufflavum]MCE7796924.1 sulfotransferase [Sphingobium sufflavum]